MVSIEQLVRSALARRTERDAQSLNAADDLIADLAMTPLTRVLLLRDIERALGVDLSADRALVARTVGELVASIARDVARRGRRFDTPQGEQT